MSIVHKAEIHADMRPVLAINHKAAQKRAHRLFAFSSAVWAKEWYKDAETDFVEDLFEFCNYAYKVCEIVNLKDMEMDISTGGALHFEPSNEVEWLLDFRRCLNAVRHCTSFKFGIANAPTGRMLFANNQNMLGPFVLVTTDKYPQQRGIPIFPLAFGYLHYVRRIAVEILRKS